ncbi:TetR/AcrR family transcriptional regulator [Streptomyces sp.]|uniref:TetR/AcrR family transcriptional regulator n=1 Tax=Streptomyces sp. TaxID=1931 RepID=UPI002F41DB05
MPDALSERDRLLALTTDYVLEHGVAELTLRRLGQAIGTNNRMLLYYFGSKEQLITAVLRAAGDRFPEVARALEFQRPDETMTVEAHLTDTWNAIAAEENLPMLRMFFEVFGLAMQQRGRFDDFLELVNREWRDHVTRWLARTGVPAPQAEDLAREIVGLWRGLQMELVSGSDRSAVDRTHAIAAASIAERARQALRTPSHHG